MNTFRSKWGWAVGIALLLVVLLVVTSRGGPHTTAAMPADNRRNPTTVPKPIWPRPRPRSKPKKKPRQIVRQRTTVTRTTTVVVTPPPQTVTVTVTRTIEKPASKPAAITESRPKAAAKPKPKLEPRKKPVIARFVWVIAAVSTASGSDNKATIRLREYRGRKIVRLAVLKSGTAYRYRYIKKTDQLCQVIRPGTTATSPVCVQIKGGNQVIIFTSSKV